ncbi:mechanosensitive ion channel family protein [Coraliomargarita parva]|uniref:mechanosensitive ion channel family protein n=1 Tax=Coraliomargarita parva TaxID=3014050 RepID=UPI0022B57691|nr:mechanosensitive ion channel family protein [Coraliomargarita parva]
MTAGEIFNTPIIADNELWRIAGLFVLLLAAMTAGKLLNYLLQKRGKELEDSRPILACGMCGAARAATFLSFAIGLSAGVSLLRLHGAESFVNTSIAVIVTLAVATTLYFLVEMPGVWMVTRATQTESKMDDMLAPIVSKSLRATIVVLAVVQIAQILSGKEITSILAGLGIGGLAVALAAQDTLKNFFGSVVLLADKPFEIGDRINVDGHDGPVEAVGLRSTKIRTLDGHLVTIPNGELANKSIWNIAKRPYIRRLFTITVTYDTPPEKMHEAKAILEDILKDHEGMAPDFPPRVYFKDFNDASLGFLCIYWYHPPAYWDFLSFTEHVNLQILERFNAAGIDFAFPTQTLHLAGDPKRPLEIGFPGKDA